MQLSRPVRQEVSLRILVIGGCGFAGSHLVLRLLQNGHDVTVLDPQPGVFDEEISDQGACIERGSIADAATVDRCVAGAEIVYNLASPFGDILALESEYQTVEVHGPRNVFAAAEKHGIRRVVHCSTQGVHGSLEHTPGDENSPIRPLDFYCRSKAEGERVCKEFIDRGLDVTIVRPTSVYGPGDLRGWLKLFRMVERGWFLMIGSGRTMNHPIYVENLVDLFELAATVPEAKGRTYLAGDADAVTLNRLVRMVGDALGTRVRMVSFPSYRAARAAVGIVEAGARLLHVVPPVFQRRLSWFRTNRAFSIERAVRELDYQPRVELQEGLERTADWYRAHGYL